MDILYNKIFIFFERVANLFILNLVFIIACIPIFTFFPAIAAMYSVIRQWKLKKETTVIKPFINQFKLNFKQIIVIGFLWVPFGFSLYINYCFIIQISSQWKIFLLVPIFSILLIYVFMSTFLFPIMVHYQLTLKNILKNTFIISLVYFPTTLLLLMIYVILLVIALFLPITAIFIFSFGAYINFLLCNNTFRKIEGIVSHSK